jgi:hypothetical protein
MAFALAVCAVVLFLLLQWSLNRASVGRTRSGRRTVREWISGLLTNAIVAGFLAFLLTLLASWIVPEYVEPVDPWPVIGFGALAGMIGYLRISRSSSCRTQKPDV